MNISGDMRRLLLIILSTVYLQQQDTVIQLSVLEILSKFVKRSPTLVSKQYFISGTFMILLKKYVVSRSVSFCAVSVKSTGEQGIVFEAPLLAPYSRHPQGKK